ncbi:MAG: Hint domain-containing protein [Rhodobacteraceae bacterium]|nr:Hint domain-containing protein [Paracoccaceae bacterium]
MSVTINGAIVLSPAAPGVTTESRDTSYAFDNGDFVEVLNDLTFTGNINGQAIGPGSTVTINDIEYTLEGIFDFWAKGSTINLETGDESAYEGQFLGLTLINPEDPEGTPLNLVLPANSLLRSEDWTGDPINTITVFSNPTESSEISAFQQDDGSFENKLSDGGIDIVCFTAGTLIDTRQGPVAVEDLRPGDMVLTRDNGFLPLVWCGQRRVSAAEMAAAEDLAPVLIAQGALGNGLPEQAMRVSPQHRMLVTGPRAELMFGEREVLVPAIDMVGLPGITRDRTAATYVHIMFDSHQIVRADGAWSESFQPADWAMGGLDAAQRTELLALFPALATAEGRRAFRSARMILKPQEARALLSAA